MEDKDHFSANIEMTRWGDKIRDETVSQDNDGETEEEGVPRGLVEREDDLHRLPTQASSCTALIKSSGKTSSIAIDARLDRFRDNQSFLPV